MKVICVVFLITIASLGSVHGADPCGQLVYSLDGSGPQTVAVATDCSGEYCPSLSCNFTLCGSGLNLLLELTALDIEESPFCQYDRLVIRGQPYCGTQPPDPIALNTDSGQCGRIQFQSDANNGGTGFSLTYRDLSLAETACSSSPCANGGTCVVGHNTSVYSCQCAYGWDGDLCQFDALCRSGLYSVDTEVLALESPQYCNNPWDGDTQCPNMDCLYTACLTSKDAAVAIFTQMDMMFSPSCETTDDHLTIEGNIYCNYEILPDPFWLDNIDTCVNITYRTGSYSSGDGFILILFGVHTNCPPDHQCQAGSTCYTGLSPVSNVDAPYSCFCPPDKTGPYCQHDYLQKCGQLSYNDFSGTVSSARVCTGERYCNNLQCSYKICTGTNYVLVTFTSLDLHPGCDDRVLVGDVEVCDVIPDPIVVSATTDDGCAEVRFETNDWLVADGFVLTYTGMDQTTCDSNPCMNGGLCIPGYQSFQCQCFNEFVGSLCQTSLITTEDSVDRVTITTAAPPVFLETTVGLVVIGVTCTFALLSLALVGHYFYTESGRSNRVRPLSSLDRDPNDDLEVYDMTSTAPVYRGY